METYSYEDLLDLFLGSSKHYPSINGLSTTGRKVKLVDFSASEMSSRLPVQLGNEEKIGSVKT